MLANDAVIPTTDEIRNLDVIDIASMNNLAYIFKDSLSKYVKIDPFTFIDPFTLSDPLFENKPDDLKYFLISDKENAKRIVSIVIIKTIHLDKLPLDKITNSFLTFEISRQIGKELKIELMPKEVHNFYSLRINGEVIGYAMFAFQICGQH